MATKIFSKRTLAMLLALVMCVSSLHLSVFAVEGEEKNSVMEGYFVAEGGVVTEEVTEETSRTENGFTVSKTATLTGENQFDITLTVQTSQTVVESAAAIQLVIDASTSMEYCAQCSGSVSNCRRSGHTTRVAALQGILAGNGGFLDTLATANSGKIWVSIVKFGLGAKTHCDWVDIKTADGMTKVKNAVWNLGELYNATNMQAGLMLARNRWGTSTVANIDDQAKFTVMLTDGYANTYSNESNSTSSIGNGSSPSSANASTGGTNNAKSMAEQVRGKSALYVVGFGADASYLQNMFVTNVYAGANADDVYSAFANIANSAVEGMNGAGAKVTDPMGKYITLGVVNDSNVTSGGNALEWTLDPEKAQKDVNGATTTYTYTMTYPITLDTNAEGFQEDTYYPTNGYTYLTAETEDGKVIVPFNVPGVSGKLPYFTVSYAYEGDVPAGAPAVPGSATVKKNTEVTVAGIPYVDHYSFSGWTTGDAAVEGGKFQMPGQNVVLVGSWTEDPKYSYSVKYDGNGGSTDENLTLVGDNENSAAQNIYDTSKTFTVDANTFEREHYHFIGWADSNGNSYAPDDALELTASNNTKTLYAQWELDSQYDYSVIYFGNGGTKAGAEFYGDSENVVDTFATSHQITVDGNTFSREHYDFIGWKDVNGNPYAKDQVVNLTKDNDYLALYAQWQEHEKYNYTVTYYANYEGASPASKADGENVTQVYETTKTFTVDANTFEREHYNFVGWATSPEGAVVYAEGAALNLAVEGNNNTLDLYAVWVEHDKYTFAVIYNGNGGVAGDVLAYGDDENVAETYASSCEIEVDENTFSREHYDFIGWNTEANGTGVAYTAEEVLALTASAENKSITITLYAQWEEHEKFDYEVVYIDDSNEDSVSQTDSESVVETYENPYDIEVDDNTYFTRENYTFIGWAIVEEVEAVAEDAEIVVDYLPGDVIEFTESGRVVLRAVWEENPKYDYTLTYDGNGGELVDGPETYNDSKSCEDTYETSREFVVDDNNFNRDHYDFIGWNTKADGTGEAYEVDAEIVFENGGELTLYAQWEEHEKYNYLVVYNANFGDNETKFDEENVVSVYDTAYIIRTNDNTFVRENYTFIGWNTKADGTGESYAYNDLIGLTAEENAVILYAQWQENPKYDYTVTYNACYGLVPATKDDAQNATQIYLETYAITVDENTFVRDHYDFIGWSTEKDGEVEFLANDMITFTEGGSEELFAVWTEHDKYAYTVIYNGNGGALEDAAVSYGDSENVVDTYATEHTAFVDANTFVREHYDFIGWNTKADGTGDAYTAEQALALTAENNSITLYAQWEEHEKFDYEVIYHPNTEDPIESIPDSENVKDSYETEKEFTVDENTFVNENEEFIGWSTEPDGEVVYKPGDVIEFTEGGKVDLYAQWEPMDREYTVVYYIQVDNNPYAPFTGEVPAGGVLPHGTVVGMEIVNPPASITDGTYTYEFVRLDEIVLGAGENVVNVFFRYETPAPVVPETEEPATEPEEPATEPAQPATVDDDGLVELPDEDVPLASAPNTGDPMLIYAGMTLLSGAGLAYLGLGKKKEEEEE